MTNFNCDVNVDKKIILEVDKQSYSVMLCKLMKMIINVLTMRFEC